jgi:hypothetical protein
MSSDDKAGIQHLDHELALHHDPKAIEALPDYVEGTPEETKLVRKIDWHLIPILWAMYVFNYLDRTNIGVSAFFSPRVIPGYGPLTIVTECQSGRNGRGSQLELFRLLPDPVHFLRCKWFRDGALHNIALSIC